MAFGMQVMAGASDVVVAVQSSTIDVLFQQTDSIIAPCGHSSYLLTSSLFNPSCPTALHGEFSLWHMHVKQFLHAVCTEGGVGASTLIALRGAVYG